MTQHWINLTLQELFPNHKIIQNETLEGKYNFDVIVPELKLAFDYKGEHNFVDADYAACEDQKRKYCNSQGITFIVIPYWWMGDSSSFVATVQIFRPDIIKNLSTADPIPEPPPEPRRRRGGRLASKLPSNFLLKAREYREGMIDPTGWWMSEKLDGVRAHWDGQKLFSKTGNEIFAPPYFTKVLPRFPLDGELWKGKGFFEETCTAVIRRKPTDEQEWVKLWEGVTYHIFDAPEYPGPFENRMDYAKKLVGTYHPILRIIPMKKCEGLAHLKKELELVRQTQGEGLMLREPGCDYVHGRSRTLLKVKPYREDEVRMVGKNTEAKSLIGETRNGEQCTIKCSLWDFECAPQAGAVITVRHAGHHKSGKPKFPFMLRVRKDVTWEEVLAEE